MTPMKFIHVTPSTDPAEVACRLHEAVRHPSEETVLAKSQCGAWSVLLSHDVHGWMFSAKLMTPGSIEKDWRLLGELARCMGAPVEPMPQTILTDPNASHKWHWFHDDVPQDLRDFVTQVVAQTEATLAQKRRTTAD